LYDESNIDGFFVNMAGALVKLRHLAHGEIVFRPVTKVMMKVGTIVQRDRSATCIAAVCRHGRSPPTSLTVQTPTINHQQSSKDLNDRFDVSHGNGSADLKSFGASVDLSADGVSWYQRSSSYSQFAA
jgi:hypothetical protein